MEQTERQDQILAALLRLVARGGIEAVNLRTVAQEASCSLGMVQRQFPSKDALLEAAIEYSMQQLEQRVQRKLLRSDPASSQLLGAILAALIDTAPETRGETVIWLSFLTQAVIVPEYAQHLRRYYQPAQREIAEIISHGQRELEFTTKLDPLETAIGLLALADGLTLQLQIGSITPEQASNVLARQLEGLMVIP